jgi:hypothetical protein
MAEGARWSRMTSTNNGSQGAPVILAFYPADWSPVCGDQMTLYSEIMPEFQRAPTLFPPVGARDHVSGPANAPVTLVEYGDCRICWKMR